MPRAWSFARVSTTNQEGGLERQSDTTAAARWCDQNGYELVDHFTFAGSAWRGSHLAEGAPLRSWLEQAVAGDLGPAPALLVEEVDRFTRQAGHVALGPLLTQVFPAGVLIVNLREGVVYSQAAFESDDRLLVDLLDDIRAAHRYSERLSRRITSYWEQARERILRGEVVRPDIIAPFWIEAAGGQWALNSLAPLARWIFDRALDVGTVTIARELNARGTPALARRGSTARPWSSGALAHHLRNPAAYGAVRLLQGRIQRDDYFPALVTRDQWDRVQAAIERRRQDYSSRGRRDVVRWIGQRVTRCDCGATVRVVTSGGRHHYLQCRRLRDQVGACPAPPYRLRQATAHLLTRLQPAQLEQLLGADGERRQALQAAAEAQQLAEGRLAVAQQQAANAEQALERAILAGAAVDVFVRTYEQAQARLRAAQGQAAEAAATAAAALQRGASPDLHADVVALLQGFAAGEDTPEQRRAVNDGIRRLGLAVTIGSGRPAMGLSVGGGPVDWQPVDPAQLAYLERGRSGIWSLDLGDAVATIDGELAEVHWTAGADEPELPLEG